MPFPGQPEFHDDETFHSLVIRCVEKNVLWKDARAILKHEGLMALPNKVLPVGCIPILSKLTGTPEEKLWAPINALDGKLTAGSSDFSDPAAFADYYLYGGKPRFCPQCLAEKPYLRVRWHLTFTNVCSVHRTTLQHYCPNDHWGWFRRSVHRCPYCETSLTAREAPVMPDGQAEGPIFVENMVYGRVADVPPLLKGLDINALLHVLVTTAREMPMHLRKAILDDPTDPGGVKKYGPVDRQYFFKAQRKAYWGRSLSLGLALLTQDVGKIEAVLRQDAQNTPPGTKPPHIMHLYYYRPGGAYTEMIERAYDGLQHRPWLKKKSGTLKAGGRPPKLLGWPNRNMDGNFGFPEEDL